MTHHGTKTITTDRLILRQFKPEDAVPMFKNWASDPRVTHFLTWTPHASVEVSMNVVNDWCTLYQSPSYYHWCIEFEGEPIGGISVVRQNDRDERAELGYCIGHDFWGRGITAEAARGVINFLFSEICVHRVEIHHATDNPASGRVAEKCGLCSEGILRQRSKTGTGEFKDIRVWGVLREEWEPEH